MFKTVRAQHGAGELAAELEYTILPQSDDRSPSASSDEDEPLAECESGRHVHRHDYHHHHQQKQHTHHQQYHQQHKYHQLQHEQLQQQHEQQQQFHHHYRHRRSSVDGNAAIADGTRRTVIIIIAMLVLGCGVVAAAVLVPILLAARLVSVPTSARLQTFAVAASGVIHSARGDYVQLLPVKHAPPGTVIEFEPLQDLPPPPPHPPANRRRKRRAWPPTVRRNRQPVADFVARHRFRTGTPAAAGFRPLDFRIRQ